MLNEDNHAKYGVQDAQPQMSDSGNKYLHKYLYITGGGKKRTWSQVESKVLVGNTEAKSLKQVRDERLFMEALGAPETLSLSGGSTVKVEDVLAAEVKALADTLRTHRRTHAHTHTCARRSAFTFNSGGLRGGSNSGRLQFRRR